MDRILKAAIFTPTNKGWGLPLLFWGDSGLGKSDRIEAFGRRWGMPVMVLAPGEMGEGAFGVTPVPRVVDSKTGLMRMTYPAPDWIDMFEDSDGRGIVFCDELTTAEPHIQAAELGLINSRRIGGTYLGALVRVIGAANDPRRAANGHELSAPLANRLGHISTEAPGEEQWGQHLISANGMKLDSDAKREHDPAAEEKRVLELWPAAWAKASGLVSSFHLRNRGKLHKQPEAGDPASGKAWPSHRSWSKATAALAASEVHNLTETEAMELVAGFVGDGCVKELLEYRQAMDLPDPAELIAGRVKWAHEPHRLDRSMAVLNSAASYLIGLQIPQAEVTKDTRVKKMWEILDSVPADDIVTMAGAPLVKAKLQFHAAAMKPLARLTPMLKAAGLIS